MIKRTGEVTLGIIGLILAIIVQGAITIGCFVVVRITNQPDGLQSFVDNYNQAVTEYGGSISSVPDASTVLNQIHTFAGLSLVATIITLILAILAIIFITGNKKPVLAGFLYFFTAILVFVVTFATGFIPALLFLIAAIMSWVRKPRDPFTSF
ncbi:DUF4064 domain-containing protein [Listeria ilorinensis]|uniref:DUF4064 domain-containing protein n=1 Tax=Listeria ilorinensis TaxID=2867439 RepID=UPI001EF6AD2D|nr:DUF4064 domain-containing protein [Listeria ilorinensis]